jgi:hypothetical protein
MKLENQNVSSILVYISGLVTSLIALALVYAGLIFLQFNILGFYIWFLPIGSLIAGLAAGSGYFAISRLLNVRTNTLFTVVSAITAVVVYTAAYFMLYVYLRQSTSIEGFIRYMLSTASNSSLTIGKSMKSTIDNVGIFGYVLLGLEYVGFVLGSILPVTYGKDKPFCNDCKLFYKDQKGLAYVPALENAEIGNPDSPEGKALIAKNNEILKAENGKIKSAIRAKSYDDRIKYLEQLGAQGFQRYTFYLTFGIQKCPNCGNHIITSTLNSHVNKDGSMITEELGILSSSPESAS